MPLTPFQERITRLLATDRSPDSYLAGGAALHIAPTSQRFSNDLDYFQDSVERVATAFSTDRSLLLEHGFAVEVSVKQAGFVRALVKKGQDATKIDWAHDAAWRFLPTMRHDVAGYLLHPIDLAVNKLLALVGRDEPRDFLDILFAHEQVLSLGALSWAAAGKDPGFTPDLLLSLLRRRGRISPEDIARLHLREKPDLVAMKQRWLEALEQAEALLATLPPEQLGCLYYSKSEQRFVSNPASDPANVVMHHGSPGGSLPEGYAG
jgi:hypothetical protein